MRIYVLWENKWHLVREHNESGYRIDSGWLTKRMASKRKYIYYKKDKKNEKSR